jgi:molybdate transport system ATP-binding protein
VLIDAGRVVGFGPVAQVAARADLPLALRDDATALLHGRIVSHDLRRDLTEVDAGGATFWLPRMSAAISQEIRMRVPAREVILASEAPESISLHNIIPGIVRRIVPDRARRAMMVEVALPDGALIARVTPDAITRLNLAPDRPVLALIKSTSIEVPGH